MIRKRKNSILIFIALSLFVHFSIVLSMYIKKRPVIEPKPEVIEVSYDEPPAPPPPELTDQLPPDKKLLEQQIVEQKKQLNDEIAKTDRLSAFNQRVEQETRAQQSGKFNNSAKSGKKVAGSKEGKKDKKVAKEKPREEGELPQLDDLIPKYSEHNESESVDTETPGDPSQTDDYLKDVKTGMQTLLSTREFVYFSYYQRIKEQIRQYWEPGVREKVKIIYRQGRTIASQKDRMTQLLITLDAKGDLIDIEVISTSGVQQLDDAAVDAFKAAAPFPNPPAGMVESDGKIKIRWDFILEAANDSYGEVYV